MMDKLSGKKTYTICILTFVFAAAGLLIGKLDAATATQLIISALIGAGLRHGISANY